MMLSPSFVAAKNENSKPDSDCFFNPNGFSNCIPNPITGKYPSGFSANDNGNSFPKAHVLLAMPKRLMTRVALAFLRSEEKHIRFGPA